MATPRTRRGNYPAVLSYGFRPFFLLGSLWAGFAILLWLPLLSGELETHSLFAAVDWHIHEMLFGYLAAIATGFLLTAIPNWTGRLPVQGLPLLGARTDMVGWAACHLLLRRDWPDCRRRGRLRVSARRCRGRHHRGRRRTQLAESQGPASAGDVVGGQCAVSYRGPSTGILGYKPPTWILRGPRPHHDHWRTDHPELHP